MIAAVPPQVSVCIPTYNYGKFITDAIESVLAQTFGDFELLVVDNCSDDDTPQLVAPYVQKDNRVRYFRNDTNIGMVGNWNRCLELACGEYVKILCADDLLETTCIEKQAGILDVYPEVELVSCGRILVDNMLASLETVSFSDDFTIRRGVDVINEGVLKGNQIGEPTAVLFRSRHVMFEFRYGQVADLKMWFTLIENGSLAHIAEPLCKIRQHELQETNANRINASAFEAMFVLAREYFEKQYVTVSYLQKQEYLFQVAYSLSRSIGTQLSPVGFRELVRKHYSLWLFYVLLGLKRMKGLFRCP